MDALARMMGRPTLASSGKTVRLMSRLADDGGVRDHYPEDVDIDPEAEPGVSPEPDTGAVGPAVSLHVDGEVFDIRADGRGGTDYVWSSGPNPGYGFGLSPTEDMSLETHRENVQKFLAEIDPATGYLREP